MQCHQASISQHVLETDKFSESETCRLIPRSAAKDGTKTDMMSTVLQHNQAIWHSAGITVGTCQPLEKANGWLLIAEGNPVRYRHTGLRAGMDA